MTERVLASIIVGGAAFVAGGALAVVGLHLRALHASSVDWALPWHVVLIGSGFLGYVLPVAAGIMDRTPFPVNLETVFPFQARLFVYAAATLLSIAGLLLMGWVQLRVYKTPKRTVVREVQDTVIDIRAPRETDRPGQGRP